MKTIQDTAAFLFVLAVAILTAVCVLGVWNFFSHDVIWKSFETVGLLALAAVIVIVAGRFIGSGAMTSSVPAMPNPVFKELRRLTLSILIVAAALLAFIGVLSIWDVITDTGVLYKSVGSLSILAFVALVMVVTCMERENNPMLRQQAVSGIGVVFALILLYLVFAFSGLFS